MDIVDDEVVFALKWFWMWPVIEGGYFDAEQPDPRYGNLTILSIPVRIGTESFWLRCGYDPFGEGYGKSNYSVKD